MSHSKVRLWVHSIFSTRFRESLILPSIESKIYQIIFNQFALSGCHVEQINGMPDHIHVLFLLNPQMALSDLMRICKGGSSHEINTQNILPVKFTWQSGYWAFSVSESKMPIVKRYIQLQKTHHRIKDMAEELAWLEQMHGLVP